MISEIHETTPFVHLFVRLNIVWIKLCLFLVKEIHRLHNSVTKLDITKIDIALSSMFHQSAPADNRAYLFDIFKLPQRIF